MRFGCCTCAIWLEFVVVLPVPWIFFVFRRGIPLPGGLLVIDGALLQLHQRSGDSFLPVLRSCRSVVRHLAMDSPKGAAIHTDDKQSVPPSPPQQSLVGAPSTQLAGVRQCNPSSLEVQFIFGRSPLPSFVVQWVCTCLYVRFLCSSGIEFMHFCAGAHAFRCMGKEVLCGSLCKKY